jgi:predicted RNA-binding protein with PUA-like domain
MADRLKTERKEPDMAYWLVKSEPSTWSWDDQVRDGTTFWDGVRNYQASNNMKAMKKGDLCFFYHSVKEKQIVGIVEVAKEYYPDHTDKSGRFGMVDVKAVKPMKKFVTLADIKAEPRLGNLALVRQSRLSVVPVNDEEWKIICAMGETKA